MAVWLLVVGCSVALYQRGRPACAETGSGNRHELANVTPSLLDGWPRKYRVAMLGRTDSVVAARCRCLDREYECRAYAATVVQIHCVAGACCPERCLPHQMLTHCALLNPHYSHFQRLAQTLGELARQHNIFLRFHRFKSLR